MGEEGAAARRIDADVQEGERGGRFHIQVRVADLLLARQHVLDVEAAFEARLGGGSGQDEMPLEAALGGKVGLSRELRHPADDEAGDVENDIHGAAEERVERRPVAAAAHELHQLGAGNLEGGIRAHHGLAVGLRAQSELHLVVDGEVALEGEPVQLLADDDGLPVRGGDDLGRVGGARELHAQAELSGALRRKRSRAGQPVQGQPVHREGRLERASEDAREIRALLERAKQIQRDLRGEHRRRLARKGDRRIEGRAPFPEEEPGAYVHPPQLRSAEIVRIEG